MMKKLLACLIILALALPAFTTLAQGGGTAITPENAAQVVQLARFGRGLVLNVDWSPDGAILMVAGSVGIWLYDASDVTAEPTLLTGHTEPVLTAAFSPDGSRIASGSEDDTVRLWDAATGEEQMTLISDAQRLRVIRAVAFTPDGKRLAAAGDDRAVHVWSLGNFTELFTPMEGHTGTIYGLSFAPDGRTLASASADGTVRIWDTGTGTESAVLTHPDDVRDVAFSPDGSQLVTACDDDIVRIWDVQTGVELQAIEGHERNVNGVDYSPNGDLVASASDDDTVRLWDPAEGIIVLNMALHEEDVNRVRFSPDGSLLASVGEDETVRIWDTATGLQTAVIPGHTDRAVAAVFSPDQPQILVGYGDGLVRLWDANGNDADPLQTLEGHKNTSNVTTIAYSPDGSVFASTDGFRVTLWQTSTSEMLRELDDDNMVNGFTFSPDGAIIAVATWTGDVVLWDVSSGQSLASLTGHTDFVNSVVFSADGSQLLTSDSDGTARVWGIP